MGRRYAVAAERDHADHGKEREEMVKIDHGADARSGNSGSMSRAAAAGSALSCMRRRSRKHGGAAARRSC
jgi:hypothetical protein